MDSLDSLLHKVFVQSFVKYLKDRLTSPELTRDLVESLEVAIQCLEAVHDLDQSEEESDEDVAAGGDGLPRPRLEQLEQHDLFDMFRSAWTESRPDRLQQAEEIKNEGNNLMKAGKFYEALQVYNKAIYLDARNPIFYCNRAAAYTRLNEFNKAITDCKMALSYSKHYSKAYGRMGVAYSSLERYQDAIEAYRRAIMLEPNNSDYKTNLSMVEKKRHERIVNRAFNNSSAGPSNTSNKNSANQPDTTNVSDMRNLFTSMMSDPNFQPILNAAANGADVVTTTRELLGRMTEEYPDLFTSNGGILEHLDNIKQQIEQQLNQGEEPNLPNTQSNLSGGNEKDMSIDENMSETAFGTQSSTDATAGSESMELSPTSSQQQFDRSKNDDDADTKKGRG